MAAIDRKEHLEITMELGDDMTETKMPIEVLQQHLIKAGYSGLYYPGECACEINDLAPCGEDYSECEYGHKHTNPGDESDWCVSNKVEPPTPEQWAEMESL